MIATLLRFSKQKIVRKAVKIRFPLSHIREYNLSVLRIGREVDCMDFREMMKAKGLNPYKLELMTGIRHDKIQYYASGKRFPNLKNIIKLARALECHPTEVFESLYETYLKTEQEVGENDYSVHGK